MYLINTGRCGVSGSARARHVCSPLTHADSMVSRLRLRHMNADGLGRYYHPQLRLVSSDIFGCERPSRCQIAETHKELRYSDLSDFCLLSVETLLAFKPRALELVDLLVAHNRSQTDKDNCRSCILKRLGAAVQVENAQHIIEVHSRDARIS